MCVCVCVCVCACVLVLRAETRKMVAVSMAECNRRGSIWFVKGTFSHYSKKKKGKVVITFT